MIAATLLGSLLLLLITVVFLGLIGGMVAICWMAKGSPDVNGDPERDAGWDDDEIAIRFSHWDHGSRRNIQPATSVPPPKPAMKLVAAFAILIALLFAACLLTGCARMSTKQSDQSHVTTYRLDETGRTNSIVVETRTTTTTAAGAAAVSSSQALEGFAARQDGQNQGLTIQRTSQRSDIDKALDLMDRLGSRAAAMYGVPLPPSAPTSAPAGKKWVLVPSDDPSTPKPEIE